MISITSRVQLNGIHLYGFHGVSAEEQNVGSWFQIDLDLDVNISSVALIDDDLSGTIDHSAALRIVTREFAITSQLLEHLAHRIAKSLFEYSEDIRQVHIKIQKMTPPLPANIVSSSVEFVFAP